MTLAPGWSERRKNLWYLFWISASFVLIYGIPVAAFVIIQVSPKLFSDAIIDVGVKITPFFLVWSAAGFWVASIIDAPYYTPRGNEALHKLSLR